MRHEESRLQRQCVQWFRLQYPKRTIFAIPNGGARSKTEAAIMKGEGVLAGVADLFVMAAGACGGHGLFIEMKSGTGRLTETQKAFGQAAFREYYWHIVVRSLDEFMFWVNKYFGNE